MNHKLLWAPWRIKYVSTSDKKSKGCIFCNAKTKNNSQVIFKTKHCIVMLNIYPYNNGHLMVAPFAHVNDISKLTDEQALDLFRTIKKTQALLHKTLKPHGFNIGMNISRTAGAGITEHIHVHIVPRWNGDTNFMPVLFSTKIISQSLQELQKILKNAYTAD